MSSAHPEQHPIAVEVPAALERAVYADCVGGEELLGGLRKLMGKARVEAVIAPIREACGTLRELGVSLHVLLARRRKDGGPRKDLQRLDAILEAAASQRDVAITAFALDYEQLDEEQKGAQEEIVRRVHEAFPDKRIFVYINPREIGRYASTLELLRGYGGLGVVHLPAYAPTTKENGDDSGVNPDDMARAIRTCIRRALPWQPIFGSRLTRETAQGWERMGRKMREALDGRPCPPGSLYTLGGVRERTSGGYTVTEEHINMFVVMDAGLKDAAGASAADQQGERRHSALSASAGQSQDEAGPLDELEAVLRAMILTADPLPLAPNAWQNEGLDHAWGRRMGEAGTSSAQQQCELRASVLDASAGQSQDEGPFRRGAGQHVAPRSGTRPGTFADEAGPLEEEEAVRRAMILTADPLPLAPNAWQNEGLDRAGDRRIDEAGTLAAQSQDGVHFLRDAGCSADEATAPARQTGQADELETEVDAISRRHHEEKREIAMEEDPAARTERKRQNDTQMMAAYRSLVTKTPAGRLRTLLRGLLENQMTGLAAEVGL